MKKLIFSAFTLEIGGIETALVTLLNELSKKKEYQITLVLEKKQGVFLKHLASAIQILEYTPCDSKNMIYRKIVNFIKHIGFSMKYKNKFDFSACFATYSLSANFVARIASRNCALWGHADYMTLFNQDKEQCKEFFIQRNYDKFEHIVFVSEEGKKSFLSLFPEMESKTMVCNNLIDDQKIIEKAKEKIDFSKPKETTLFVNVGRHDERQKQLSRIIEAAYQLKKEMDHFQVLFIGDGPDTQNYYKMVEEKGLQDIIVFLGRKENPYPYMKMADCMVLSSDYEGYPVVFLESFILEKPLITTNVSDVEQVEGKRGMVVEKTEEAIYIAMKQFIEKGYLNYQPFDAKKYNKEMMNKLEKMF